MSTRTRKPKPGLRAPRRVAKAAPPQFIVPGLSLEAFKSVTRQPDTGKKKVLTMREFRESLECGEDRARQIMRALVNAGWARPTRKNVLSLSNVTQPVAAYEFLETQESANG
jgi:hypothetical protein